MKQKKPLIKTVTWLRGTSAVARKVGCTQSHLSRVLRGHRPAGPALAAKLARLGIKPPAHHEQETGE